MAGYDYEHLLNTLRNPGDDGVPETIYDDLGAAYNEQKTSADAKISELSNAVAEKDAELLRVRAHNYDLLTAVQAGNPTEPRGDLDANNTDQGEDVEVTSIEDIISYS